MCACVKLTQHRGHNPEAISWPFPSRKEELRRKDRSGADERTVIVFRRIERKPAVSFALLWMIPVTFLEAAS